MEKPPEPASLFTRQTRKYKGRQKAHLLLLQLKVTNNSHRNVPASLIYPIVFTTDVKMITLNEAKHKTAAVLHLSDMSRIFLIFYFSTSIYFTDRFRKKIYKKIQS